MTSTAAERALLTGIHAGLALVLLTPLVSAPGVFYPETMGKAIYSQSVIAVVFVLWVALASSWPRWRPPPSAILAALAASLAAAFVSAWFGVSFERSLWSTYTRMDGLVSVTHWAAFALVLAGTVRSAGDWNRLLNVNLCVGLAVALVAIVSFLYPDGSIPGLLPEERYPRISATTGNPTFLGAYMQMIALLAAGRLARSWRAAPARLFWAVTMVCAIVALVLSGSLGALAGLGTGAGVAAALYAWLGRSPRARRCGRRGIGALAAAGLLLALALGLRAARSAGEEEYQPAFDNIMLERATSVERLGNTLTSRLRNWGSGLLAFAERPLFGWGTGNYYVGSGRHISAREQGNQVNDHAHNMLIEEAAAKGVAGLAAYLLLWGFTGAAILRRAHAAEPREQTLAIFAGAALAGWFMQSQTLFYSQESWLQHMLLLGFAIHLEATQRASDGRAGAARWRLALAALGQRAIMAAVPARTALTLGALALAAGSFSANHAIYKGAAATYRAEFSGTFLEDMNQSIAAFEPMANGPRIILFNNVAANWDVLWDSRRAQALDLLRWADAEAPLALAAEPESWVLQHALARLYREVAGSDPDYADIAESYLERSLELAPNLDPLEFPVASPQ